MLTNNDEISELLILEAKVRKLLSIIPRTPTPDPLPGEVWLEIYRMRTSIQLLDLLRDPDERA